MDPFDEKAAADTIDLLESRLRRIEFVLSGDSSWTGEPVQATAVGKETITARLSALEQDLKKLSYKSTAVQDVLKLYARFPDLFQPVPAGHRPTTLTTPNLASIVLSSASSYPETASRLTSLKDLPIPPAAASASLITLQPRLDKLVAVQDEQAKEIAELRSRSAAVLERWYEISLVGGGECWAEWEARIEKAERIVRRQEIMREKEEKEL